MASSLPKSQSDLGPSEQEQILREKAQRQAALGKRAQAAADGTLGPVLKRWINAAVVPVAERIRLASHAYLERDYPRFASILDSPLFGLASAYGSGSPEALEPILGWCLKGSSPGRDGEGGTYAEDLILTGLGTVIQLLAQAGLHSRGIGAVQSGPHYHGVTYCLNACGDASRETALGQFLTQVQGAEAMLKLRRWDRSSWAQRDKLNAVASLMLGQVKPQLDSEAMGEVDLQAVGLRKVMRVMTKAKDGELLERRLSLRPPEPGDWKLLEVAKQPKGESDPYKSAWASFAMMILCAAQAEHGWFDIAKVMPTGRRTRARKNVLILAPEAMRHLRRDLERWLDIGFTKAPMIVPPEAGDYLTVKHKPCTGRNGPMGLRTDPTGTRAWKTACDVMAGTPWRIERDTLKFLRETEDGKALAAKSCPDEEARALILGQYAREAEHLKIYFPIYMDFRGRVYNQTTWVTYQGTDLQKGLLRFPYEEALNESRRDNQALALHISGLYGMDKAALPERLEWWQRTFDTLDQGICMDWINHAEEPVQLWGALRQVRWGEADTVPCQIDGTCNGLQHLTALFRDHIAAPFVNLTSSTYDQPPADLYGRVADVACEKIFQASKRGVSLRDSPEVKGVWDSQWLKRLIFAKVKLDRKLTKKPVMVLPYGGTRDAVEQAVTQAVLAQKPDPEVWRNVLQSDTYAAFRDRELSEHPLFHHDMRKLSGIIWDSIVETIPKAMQAMDAFRAIAKGVGERSLEWRTGPAEDDLWVVHAYPKSERQGVKFRGFHLPNSIRGMAMRVGRDEIDPGMHRTGIVANFIHSQDAHHLARTMALFGGVGLSFGAIHDCYLTRPSSMGNLNMHTRGAFNDMYSNDPLSHPVRLRDPGTTEGSPTIELPNWYALANAMGVTFPGKGEWEPKEVLSSAWFFS